MNCITVVVFEGVVVVTGTVVAKVVCTLGDPTAGAKPTRILATSNTV